MKKELFDELLESTKEMAEIKKGKKKPARVTRYKTLNPKRIRAKSGLTQERFAGLLGVKLSTYRNWEQERRSPQGPAQVLLMVADYDPSIIRKAIRAQREAEKSPDEKTSNTAHIVKKSKINPEPISRNVHAVSERNTPYKAAAKNTPSKVTPKGKKKQDKSR